VQVCNVCGRDIPAPVRFCSWCGSPVPRTTQTGLLSPRSLLHHGRYLILQQVGKGGMAAVYKAQDLQSRQHTVAIKEMSQQGLSGQELQQAIDAFIHEAELLGHLKHQNLPSIYEQFEDGGRRYLVMEFIEGKTLEDRLATVQQQGSRLPLKQVLSIGRQLCIVLEYLHTRQPPIIFRDLKPANIMLNKQQQVYLIDFGIARLFKPGQLKDTTALGSPGYAPPEQYRQATSPRSDIYSLGATLHQMLTGLDPSQSPFHFRPFSINQPALERLVLRMVSLDAKQRPTSMQEIRQALERIIQPYKPHQATVQSVQGVQSVQKGVQSVQDHKNKSQPDTTNASSSSATTPSTPLMVHAVISTNPADRQLWSSIQAQLHTLIDGFPDVRFTESNLPGGRSFANADLLLLLLSNDFLASTSCMTSVSAALHQHNAQPTRTLSIVLRPCAWEQSALTRIKTIPEDSVTHLSRYAQEQRILEVAKEIRKRLAVAALQGKTAGTMNLLQWLLWQLYGDGRKSCPYFKVGTGRYALQHMRPTGQGGILLHLLDLQQERIVTEYLIGPLNGPDLRHLLSMLTSSSSTDPEDVQGTASRRYPAPSASGFIHKTR
jgi:serine/threonine protein kinase